MATSRRRIVIAAAATFAVAAVMVGVWAPRDVDVSSLRSDDASLTLVVIADVDAGPSIGGVLTRARSIDVQYAPCGLDVAFVLQGGDESSRQNFVLDWGIYPERVRGENVAVTGLDDGEVAALLDADGRVVWSGDLDVEVLEITTAVGGMPSSTPCNPGDVSFDSFSPRP